MRLLSGLTGIGMILVTAMACSTEYVTPDEMTAFVLDEGNGLHKISAVNGTRVEVLYRPTDMWVHQELGNEISSGEQVVNLRKKYDPYLYFVVSLSRDDKEALHQLTGGFSQYGELVQTLSFRMADYVTLTTEKRDTVAVGDFMLNRTYGMSSSTDVLFVFSKEKIKEEKWIQFNLNEFGLGVGNQRFRFSMNDINNVPRIYKDEIDK